MSRAAISTVILNDQTLIGPATEIGKRRGDKAVAKTIRDLLRERIVEIQVKGDPHAPDVSTVTGNARIPAGATQ